MRNFGTIVGLVSMTISIASMPATGNAQTADWKRIDAHNPTYKFVLSYDPASVLRLRQTIIIAVRVEIASGESDFYSKVAFNCRKGLLADGFSGRSDEDSPSRLRWVLNHLNINGWVDSHFFADHKGLISFLRSKCKEPMQRIAGPVWFPVGLSDKNSYYVDLTNIAINANERIVWNRVNEGLTHYTETKEFGRIPMFHEVSGGPYAIELLSVNCTTSSTTMRQVTNYGPSGDAKTFNFKDATPNLPPPGSVGRRLVEFVCNL